MDFWARLKDAIKAQNTTQEWVAGKIGVSISTFRKWIHRKTYPDLKEGVEIAKLLEVSAEFLVTGIDHEGLNEEEIKLISAYRKLTPPERENAVLALVAWAGRRRRCTGSCAPGDKVALEARNMAFVMAKERKR